MDNVRNIGIGNPNRVVIPDYNDGDIAFIDNLSELPPVTSVKTNESILICCTKGKMQLDFNSLTYTIEKNDLLSIPSNTTISNYLVSTDFQCKIIAFSSRILQRIFYFNKDLSNIYLYRLKNPITHLNSEQTELLLLYYKILTKKIQSTPHHQYYKEVMQGLAQSFFYDLLASLKLPAGSSDKSMKQTDIIFSKFIENLHADNGKNRSVEFYANLLCITPKYLSVICKGQTGKTASQIIQENTTEIIRHQLLHSVKSIKEIAVGLEFDNLSFFGKYVVDP